MLIEYMNLETGEILSPRMAQEQFRDEYDGGDDTNAVSFEDLYQEIRNPVRLVCQFVGGERNGQVIDLAEAECLTDRRSTDWSAARAVGALVPRAELDNRPKFKAYVGPMWDGIRYEVDGRLKSDWEVSEFDQLGRQPIGVLRYESQEVYDMMCN